MKGLFSIQDRLQRRLESGRSALPAAAVGAALLAASAAFVAAGEPAPARSSNPTPEGSPAAQPAPTVSSTAAAGAPQRTVAITIDDLPGVGSHLTLPRLMDVNRRLIQQLRDAKAPAAVFVNEGKLQVDGETAERSVAIKEWVEAGFTVGNHTFSHKGLTATPLKDWEQDVVSGEKLLTSLLGPRGGKLVWFRHPFTQTGPTAEIRREANAFLAQRGYRIAPVTIEYSDWTFAALHEDAAYRPDREQMEAVASACVDYFDLMVGWYEALTKETFGRDIPQVLLLHDNAMNATLLPDLLARLKERGYRFVSLEEALADPAYQTPDGYIGPYGPSWLHRWRAGMNLPSRLKDEPDPPGWILEADRARKSATSPPTAQPPAAAPPDTAAPSATASATAPGRP